MNIGDIIKNSLSILDGNFCSVTKENKQIYEGMMIATNYVQHVIKTRGLTIDVSVLYSDSYEKNAFATLFDQKYYIVVYKGLILELNNVIEAFVNNARFDVIKEQLTIEKSTIKESLFTYSIQFLVAHELAHLRFGHIDYLINNGVNLLLEAVSKVDTNSVLLYQTLEFDADCCGISTVVSDILNVGLVLGDVDIVNTLDMYVKAELAMCNLSIHILFNLLDDKDEADPNKSHPLTSVRVGYIGVTIFTRIDMLDNKKIVKTYCDFIIDICLLTINSFQGILKWNFLYDIYKGIGNEQFNKIHRNWKVVREQLAPYAHDGLAPYTEEDFKQLDFKE